MATMTVVDSVSEIMEETLNRLIAEGKMKKGCPLFILGKDEPKAVKLSMFVDFKLVAADEVYCYFEPQDIMYETNSEYVNKFVLGLIKVVPVSEKKYTVTTRVVRGVYTPASEKSKKLKKHKKSKKSKEPKKSEKSNCKRCAAMKSEGYYFGNCSQRCWSQVFA